MRLALVPRQSEFYELFARAGENALAAARVVEERFRAIGTDEIPQERLKELEHEGDRLTGELIGLLNTQYVTPIDREDIYALAGAIDDAVDFMDDASELLDLYRIDSARDEAHAQCRVLVQSAEQLSEALNGLRGLKGAQERLFAIKALEDEGDAIHRDAIAALFANESISARDLVKWKDIHEALEEAIDACETAAHLIGNIIVKNG